MEKVRIITADDHNILQHGLCRSLEMEDGFEVSARADSGQTAIELAAIHQPDLIIMDVGMPRLNGMEATKQILDRNSSIKIIALSMHIEKIYITGMINAGAMGYVLKSCSFKVLLNCIQAVLKGKYFFCPEVRQLMGNRYLATISNNISDERISVFSLLSSRERQVLQLIAEGHTSRQIAKGLDISAKTVDVHRTNLKAKLNIQTVAGLTKFAISEGLTSASL